MSEFIAIKYIFTYYTFLHIWKSMYSMLFCIEFTKNKVNRNGCGIGRKLWAISHSKLGAVVGKIHRSGFTSRIVIMNVIIRLTWLLFSHHRKHTDEEFYVFTATSHHPLVLHQNIKRFVHENASENVVWEMEIILCRGEMRERWTCISCSVVWCTLFITIYNWVPKCYCFYSSDRNPVIYSRFDTFVHCNRYIFCE